MSEQERKIIAGLLSEIDRNTCLHEDTYRGGVIWTICRDCGAQWADDEGGFRPHVDKPEVVAAREYLCQREPATLAAPEVVDTGTMQITYQSAGIDRDLDRMHEDARAALSGFCSMSENTGMWSWTHKDAVQQAWDIAEAMAAERAARKAKMEAGNV